MNNACFTIFEHDSLIEGEIYGENKFTAVHHKQLVGFFKEKKFPYYTLIKNGVRFKQYVGVIQIGNTLVEVLPKADKNGGNEYWRIMLFDMLKSTGIINVSTPSSSNLNIRKRNILELYFEIFINECEMLLRRNLIKRYRSIEGNINSLKGSIVFSKHIRDNIVHQERFYTKHTIYDQQHPLNKVLYKTIKLLNILVKSNKLKSRIGELLLNFPELPDINVNEKFFNSIQYNRKSEAYRTAIEISKLILLNYHPDVTRGNNHVLALMFNMNNLWEKFVLKSLKNNNQDNYKIVQKPGKNFWHLYENKQMYPDIVISKNDEYILILDTKWKNIEDQWPSDSDLRQMYTYSKFYNEASCALVYPGTETNQQTGYFFSELNNKILSEVTCSIKTIKVEADMVLWQKQIRDELFSGLCLKRN